MCNKYFFYKPVEKSLAEVVTAQGVRCKHVGKVKLQIRIRSQGFRSSESSEKHVEKRKKTSVAGNKSRRREQWVYKLKRTSSSNESSVGLRQQTYKKRTPVVRRLKRGVPSSLEGKRDKKRKPPNRDSNKRRLPSSTSSNQQARKRNRRTEENNGQVTARSSRAGLTQDRPLQSSQIQPGRSKPYNLRNRGKKTRKAGSRSSERTVKAKEGPVRSRRDQPRRLKPYDLRHRRQFRQDFQDLRSRRSTLLEVHIGDIKERR
ncbi:hypothetical protein TNCV_818511 [Trichonephila clavipes]|nr:hypothetical protein TNCV_818511 [Trichonephila clavipes]